MKQKKKCRTKKKDCTSQFSKCTSNSSHAAVSEQSLSQPCLLLGDNKRLLSAVSPSQKCELSDPIIPYLNGYGHVP